MRTTVFWADTGTRRYTCGDFVVHLAADTPHDGLPSGLWVNGIVDAVQVCGGLHLPTAGFAALSKLLRDPTARSERVTTGEDGMLLVRVGECHALRGLGRWQVPGAKDSAAHAPAALWQRIGIDVSRLLDGRAWNALPTELPHLPPATEVASLGERFATPRR